MEAYDLAHKLAYAGRHSAVPFITGPEFTNSVPGVPVLSMLRIFIERAHWSEENIQTVAREVARVLGASEQFDVGFTLTRMEIGPDTPANGATARMMKLDAGDPTVMLRISDEAGDRVFRASFPRLRFEPFGEDFWRAAYTPGAVKLPSQQ